MGDSTASKDHLILIHALFAWPLYFGEPARLRTNVTVSLSYVKRRRGYSGSVPSDHGDR